MFPVWNFAPDHGGKCELKGSSLSRELLREWRSLWREKYDDKWRAEDVASRDFQLLNIDRGTVIWATRNCKPLTLEDVFRSYERKFGDRLHRPVTPGEGGWGKFTRDVLKKLPKEHNHETLRRVPAKDGVEPRACGPLKKNGRGLLHLIPQRRSHDPLLRYPVGYK